MEKWEIIKVISLVFIAINLTIISTKIDDLVYALSDIASVLTATINQ
jgi:hypothetical protein